jgi:hypothetical protein
MRMKTKQVRENESKKVNVITSEQTSEQICQINISCERTKAEYDCDRCEKPMCRKCVGSPQGSVEWLCKKCNPDGTGDFY